MGVITSLRWSLLLTRYYAFRQLRRVLMVIYKEGGERGSTSLHSRVKLGIVSPHLTSPARLT